MADFAEWLPVALIPEQLHIAAMGNDMVNHRGSRQSVFLHALHAQRMSA